MECSTMLHNLIKILEREIFRIDLHVVLTAPANDENTNFRDSLNKKRIKSFRKINFTYHVF